MADQSKICQILNNAERDLGRVRDRDHAEGGDRVTSLSDRLGDGILRLDMLEDHIEVEIGRRKSDSDYGNLMAGLRCVTKIEAVDEVASSLRNWVDGFLGHWLYADHKAKCPHCGHEMKQQMRDLRYQCFKCHKYWLPCGVVTTWDRK